MKLYTAYRESERCGGLFHCKSIAFMDYARTHEIKNGKVKLRPITGGGHNTGKSTTAVGVRFGYEMHDQYIFHFCAMFFPHYHREAFISKEFTLKSTLCFRVLCTIYWHSHLATPLNAFPAKRFPTPRVAIDIVAMSFRDLCRHCLCRRRLHFNICVTACV